jgi:hypothetical protein
MVVDVRLRLRSTPSAPVLLLSAPAVLGSVVVMVVLWMLLIPSSPPLLPHNLLLLVTAAGPRVGLGGQGFPQHVRKEEESGERGQGEDRRDDGPVVLEDERPQRGGGTDGHCREFSAAREMIETR